jgi:hypothetical protein
MVNKFEDNTTGTFIAAGTEKWNDFCW